MWENKHYKAEIYMYMCMCVYIMSVGGHGGEDLGFKPWIGDGIFLCEYVCTPRVGVGFLRELRFSPTVQEHIL